MQRKDHIHKFKRGVYKNTGNKYYFCVNDCDYKIGVEHALGKTNVCWRCGKPFHLTIYSLRLAKPHCEDCHRRKELSSANSATRSTRISNSPDIEQLIQVDSSSEDILNKLRALSGIEITEDEDPKDML